MDIRLHFPNNNTMRSRHATASLRRLFRLLLRLLLFLCRSVDFLHVNCLTTLVDDLADACEHEARNKSGEAAVDEADADPGPDVRFVDPAHHQDETVHHTEKRKDGVQTPCAVPASFTS